MPSASTTESVSPEEASPVEASASARSRVPPSMSPRCRSCPRSIGRHPGGRPRDARGRVDAREARDRAPRRRAGMRARTNRAENRRRRRRHRATPSSAERRGRRSELSPRTDSWRRGRVRSRRCKFGARRAARRRDDETNSAIRHRPSTLPLPSPRETNASTLDYKRDTTVPRRIPPFPTERRTARLPNLPRFPPLPVHFCVRFPYSPAPDPPRFASCRPQVHGGIRMNSSKS